MAKFEDPTKFPKTTLKKTTFSVESKFSLKAPWYLDTESTNKISKQYHYNIVTSVDGAKHAKKKKKVMTQQIETNTEALSSVVGRTHNPFTGVKELAIFPDTHPHAAKVMEQLKAATNPSEVEATNDKLVVRPLKRTAQAAVKIALDALDSGAITKAQAFNSVPTRQLLKLLNASIADFEGLPLMGTGLAAGPGIVVGIIAESSAEAIKMAAEGIKVILKVDHTTPEDMDALKVVVGIIALTGGYTSHSAVVARQMGKPCIVSYVPNGTPAPIAYVTIDGNNGKLYVGAAKITATGLSDETKRFMQLADDLSTMKVFANADTYVDVKVAVAAGAKGVGLCRTEHTFFSGNGINVIRKLILASDESEKYVALKNLEQIQRSHFSDFFKASTKLPVTVRLLDPPMHEFLPQEDNKEEIATVAKQLKIPQKTLTARIKELRESNPMLGHRGCRLGLTFKGLYETQTKSIMMGALDYLQSLQYAERHQIDLGIMIPLVVTVTEAKAIVALVKTKIDSVKNELASWGKFFNVTVGVMLETPRSCLIANELADSCAFFSFGTNDLTQTTWALSRDDSPKVLTEYKTQGIVGVDPFESLDITGVGVLMDHAIASLKEKRSNVKIGICGEHGGDPASIEFCNQLKLDYVSCSPTRVKGAILAAAHAAVVGDVAPGLAVQEIALEPIVQLVKVPAPVPPAVVVAKPLSSKIVTTTSQSKSTDDATKVNLLYGTWQTTQVPNVEIKWASLPNQVVDLCATDYAYVKYHATTTGGILNHVIVMVSPSQLKELVVDGTTTNMDDANTFLEKSTVCAYAKVPEMFVPKKVSNPQITLSKEALPDWANITDNAIKTDKLVEAIPTLASLQTMTLEAAAIALNGKFVKIKDLNLWCKVIGYAPNPFKTFALAVQLPKGPAVSQAHSGPMKAYVKLLTKVDSNLLSNKLKYITLEHITEIVNSVQNWE